MIDALLCDRCGGTGAYRGHLSYDPDRACPGPRDGVKHVTIHVESDGCSCGACDLAAATSGGYRWCVRFTGETYHLDPAKIEAAGLVGLYIAAMEAPSEDVAGRL
ncbi:MAG: hypothetical protein DWQ40_00310 [Actinobacteria bacterium]|nr:MAG: hypothetical protein DWQ40_00310 [Actinomycetota bacterium]REK35587.1 MAG: hypothetical protein DWQ20_06075 [Actinomycetota bacterium]